jgi:hypothetical protein
MTNTRLHRELLKQQLMNYVKPSETTTVICSGTTKKGAPCKSRTKHTSGKCHNHRD